MLEISVIRDCKVTKEIRFEDKTKIILTVVSLITLALIIGLFTYHLNYNISKLNAIECWETIEDSKQCIETIKKNKGIKIISKGR